MTARTAQTRGKIQPRPPRVPPHISLKHLRTVAGITLDVLIDRIEEETGHRYTRGALSAIENGHRGASAELLETLEVVYGLPVGAIDTVYTPRHQTRSE
ncbi:helix-turn-helix transcriptional regulator [Nocardia cyriacigeorgica]|uniref:helix-turn-helix transcriptional regulator n=1 Tax=Nocardia cyriacigeorgica TaxID=135487 RepID=UPI002457E0FE|nr:helix-turn-helix transcriptional regulator [Nocardia cyriacigeorgica]